MNRDRFNDNWKGVSQSELDRKWRAFLREREEMEILEQRRLFSSNPFTGGGLSANNRVPGSASIHFFVNHSNNIAFLVANYSNETVSEPYDTGIAYDGGNSFITNSQDNVHNGGFLPLIWDNPNTRYHAFFISNTGEVLDQIHASTYDISELNESLSFFISYDNSPTYAIYKLFDGYRVTTFTLEGVTSSSIGTSGCSAESILISYDSEFRLLNKNGQNVKIFENTLSEELYETINEWTHNYTCGFVTVPNTTDYLKFKVWSETGELLIDEDISDYTTDNIVRAKMYGNDGRFLAVLQNGGNDDVDYLVIHYDPTNGLIVDTHEKGNNFPTCEFFAEDLEKRDPSNAMKSNAVITFRNSGPGPVAVGFDSSEYLDVWCMHHTQTNYFKETITSGDEYGTRISSDNEEGAIYAGDPFFLFYDKTAVTPEIQVASFTANGLNTFGIGFDPDDIANVSSTECIAPDHAFLRFELSSDLGFWQWRIFNSTGTTSISRTTGTFTTGGGSMYNALAVIDFDDYTNCFTFSPSQGASTLPDPSPNVYGVISYNEIENEFGTSDGYSTRNVVVQTLTSDNFDPIGFSIFNDVSGLSSYVEYPAYSAFDNVRFGETILVFNYYNAVDQGYSVKIYSLENGAELSSTDTGNLIADQTDSANYGNRIWKSFTLDGTVTYYFSFASGAVSAALGATVLTNAYNDAYWIDD